MKKYLLLAAAAIATCATLAGQVVTSSGGSIQGTVTDPSGAILPGAKVVVSNPDTGYSRAVTTDRAGFFTVGPLVPGNYKEEITASGFASVAIATVVNIGTVTNGSQKLSVGSASETVQVNAGSLQVNTDQIAITSIVTRDQIGSLPVNGRNILDIAQIEPGVILQQGLSLDPTKAGYSAISLSGVSGRTTRILLDGQDITDETVGATLFNVPSGAIQEFQLNRSTQDVSGEVTSTGQVLLSTRSGTNAIHGNAFYNFQDNQAGFASVDGYDSPFQRNQFGGYVGGHLIKDKLFFFGGAERILQHELDPAQVEPLFAAIQAAYPLVPAPFHDTYSTARLDYTAPHDIRVFVRGIYSVNFDDATDGQTPYALYTNRDNVAGITGGMDFATGRWTHSFRGGYEKFHNLLQDGTVALGNSIYNPSTSAVNQITLTGSLNAGPNNLSPQGTFQSDKQFHYDGTWTRGAHNVKFGFNMNRILNGTFAQFAGPSLYTQFNAVSSLLVGSDAGDPMQYAADYYLIGNGNAFFSERPAFGLPAGGSFSWRFAAYLGDAWKVAPWLTLSGGLRWSVDTDRANQDLATPLCGSSEYTIPNCTGSQPLFDFYGSLTGSNTIGYKTHQPYANFGPQAGFVISPGSHRLSVRGGGGIYYESNVFNDAGNARTAIIQTPGPFNNVGYLGYGSSSVELPGYGNVSSFDPTTGGPCVAGASCTSVSAVSQEAIGVAAPQLNALRTYYQAQIQGKTSANPDYIGGGDGLDVNNVYAGPYLTPYSIQLNGGVQFEIKKGLIFSADYIHNATLKLPLSVDANHDGAARTLNTKAANNAVGNTIGQCGAANLTAAIQFCPGIHGPGGGGARITDFAANGLDSGTVYLDGYAAPAFGYSVDTGAAFPGDNPNVGQGLFIMPVGRSGYDALDLVLQQQNKHPLPGIENSNLQISYTLSRVVSSTSTPDQFFEGSRPFDNDNPNLYIGRNSLDHTNQLNFGGDVRMKYGLDVALIGHFYSAPPSNLVLDTLAGTQGQIFMTDVNGDGLSGDLVPGTNPGTYMHRYNNGNINKLISSYNQTSAGQLTPAGQALVSAGIFTASQLTEIGAAQQPIAPAPSNALQNAAFRTFDLSGRYPITLNRVHEGLSIVPGFAMYNIFNMSNFGNVPPTLLNASDAGSEGFINGPTSQQVLNTNRITRGAGTFDQGGPRSTEFQLSVTF